MESRWYYAGRDAGCGVRDAARIALGSQAELGTQIEAALRLGFVDAGAAKSLFDDVDRVRQMLHGLRRSLGRRHQAAVGLAFLAVLLTSTLLWA